MFVFLSRISVVATGISTVVTVTVLNRHADTAWRLPAPYRKGDLRVPLRRRFVVALFRFRLSPRHRPGSLAGGLSDAHTGKRDGERIFYFILKFRGFPAYRPTMNPEISNETVTETKSLEGIKILIKFHSRTKRVDPKS